MAEPLETGDALSTRKKDVLRRLIRRYVQEVHPISSTAVAEEMMVSSATVRNELAALKEQGYVWQPHTSGGSIPTDRAYRFLVEELLERLSDSISGRARVAQVYDSLGSEAETMFEGTLDLLTETTGYVAWVSLPVEEVMQIKSINFVEADTKQLLIVLVTGSGIMQSRLINTELPVKELGVGRLSEALNSYLRGRSFVDIDYEELRKIFYETVGLPATLVDTLRDFFSSMASGGERVVFSNALQLVLQPEFSRVDNLATVLSVLQDKERFLKMLRKQLTGRRMQTIIGSENVDAGLHECSLVLSRFELPGSGEGTVGVLGPTRQLYERTLPWVKIIGETVATTLLESGTDRSES